jgi:hypothetical protein
MNGRDIGNGVKLLVTYALSRAQRDVEMKKDLLRYK